MATETTWKPRTKAEAEMLPKYRTWSVERRFAEGVRIALDTGINVSQAEAARRVGVTRARLNEHVRSHGATLRAQADRSAIALARKRTDFVSRGEGVSTAAVPPAELGTTDLSEGPDGFPTFNEFVRKYFGSVVCPDCGVHHEIPPVHDKLMDQLDDESQKRLLINIAPYHAQSTIATVYHTVYLICRNPNVRVAIVSKSERLSKRFLRQIQDFLVNPNLYEGGPSPIDDYGPFHNPNSWSANEFWVAGRTGGEKDPTVSAYGVGAQIYGYRFDIIKFDDIADLENQRNPDRVQDMLKWAIQEAGSRVGANGKLQFIGTRISAGDIYFLLQELPGFHVVRFPCIVDDEARKTVWQDHFGWEAADLQRRSMSIEQFQLVYQNVDTPGIGASFQVEMLERAHDVERHIGEHDQNNWALVCGLDPAGANAQAGYTAMVLMGVDLTNGRRHLIDLMNVKQMKAPQVKDQIIAWADQYPLRELRVEVNGLQSQIYQYDRELNEALTNRGVRIVPHITHKTNKWDPQFGVEAMAAMFHNNMVTIPWATANERRKFRELEEQLLQFPMGQVTDLVMAMWFAELGCKEVFTRTAIPPFDNRRQLPKRITRNRRIVDFGERAERQPTEEDMAGVGAFGPRGKPETRRLSNMDGSVTVF